jgi:hypothetical protein
MVNLILINRRRTLRKLAEEIGCEFYGNNNGSYLNKWKSKFPTLNESFGKKNLTNIIQGPYNTIVLSVFDYSFRYPEITGISRKFTAAIVEDKALDLPRFQLWPKRHMELNPAALVRRKLQDRWCNLPEEYLLFGDKETAIQNIFDDRMVTCLRKHFGWSVEAHCDAMMIYQEDCVVKPVEIKQFVNKTTQIYNLFKRTQKDLV